MQLVLPGKYRQVAMEGCHGDLGHLGLERMINMLQNQFY